MVKDSIIKIREIEETKCSKVTKIGKKFWVWKSIEHKNIIFARIKERSEYNKSKGKQIIIKSNLEKNKYFNNCYDGISNFKRNSVV